MLSKLLLLLLLLWPAALFATQEERAQRLFTELRCVVCEGQSLADSQTGVASDIRAHVREMIADGKSDDDIRDLLVSRYGASVLMKPALTPQTYLLWFGPILFGALGLGIVFAYFSSARLTRK